MTSTPETAARDELLQSLGLPVAKAPADIQVGEEERQENKPVVLSPTALALDDWSVRRGADILRESEMLQKALGTKAEHLDGPEWRHTGENAKAKAAALMTADFHGAAFEPEPKLAEACENERLKQYMQNLLETPEFKALRNETMLDETASEFAAASFAKGYMALCEAPAEEGIKGDMQCMRNALHALNEAQQEVKELRNAQDAMGIGHNEIGGMFKRVKGSEQLRRIVELAGRYRRFAQAKQRQKVLHGRDDVVGVVLDGDIGRILPHELAVLDDEDLGLDLLRRIVEREVMCREYRGIETKAKGPIVVVVDESGSMSGEPIWTAKAISLALAWVARHQNRFCCLVGFAGATEGNFLVLPPNGGGAKVGQRNDATGKFEVVGAGKGNDEALMDWLEHFFGGGTDMDVPCDILPKNWEPLGCPKGKTDIVCITDAICRIPDKIRNNFLKWKEAEKVKMISLIINSDPGDLAKVSDRVHRVPSLSLEVEAVGEVLSV